MFRTTRLNRQQTGNDFMRFIEQIVAAENVQAAWQWLANRRKNSHHNSDYWHLRHHRQQLEPQIIAAIRHGTYQFSPCKQYDGVLVWSAQDALVLKAMAGLRVV